MPATTPDHDVTAPALARVLEERLLSEFRRAAGTVPAYRALLAEHGVAVDSVSDIEAFSTLAPVLRKTNTFARFSIDQLSAGGRLGDVAQVLTSSGHGGQFSFGVISRDEAAAGAEIIDGALDAAFGVCTRTTLAINCLPMGVGFGSHRMTVATTSVREDMALALVEHFGHRYEQILLVGDPLFLKKLADYARDRAFDWSRHRVNIVVGEEIFGERFRAYLGRCFGLDATDSDAGYIMSSFGVGELGLHLCYETPATIGLRRAALRVPAFARELAGADAVASGLPMMFGFDPLRTFIEVLDADRDGYGRLTVSMLDASRTVPLLRYQTDDIVRLLDRSEVEAMAARHGIPASAGLPAALLALRGRAKEALPNGGHVGVYKDALYVHHDVADHVTGALRITCERDRTEMHVQLRPSAIPSPSIEQRIRCAVPEAVRPERVMTWRYKQFPFGMSLDYERKFCHFVPGEPAVMLLPAAPPMHEAAR